MSGEFSQQWQRAYIQCGLCGVAYEGQPLLQVVYAFVGTWQMITTTTAQQRKSKDMFPRYALFGMGALIILWMLSLLGAISGLPCWASVEPEYEEGMITRGGRNLVWARVLFTCGCVVIWICTFLGHMLTGPSDITFGVWQRHPVLLQELLLVADVIFVASIAFVWNARGNRKWILCLTIPIMAVASVTGSIFLFLP